MPELDATTAELVFAIERLSWRSSGAKEARVRADLDVSFVAYHQMLADLIDSELGLQTDAVTCRRLQRVRDARLRARGRLSA